MYTNVYITVKYQELAIYRVQYIMIRIAHEDQDDLTRYSITSQCLRKTWNLKLNTL